MVVYRLLANRYCYDINGNSRNEYEDYLNGQISLPQTVHDEGINTHKYLDGVNYIHFFHFFEDEIYFISSKPSIFFDGRAFIGFYDIPKEILAKHQGFGIYPESGNPYLPVLEYAIPWTELKKEFIVGKVEPYKYIFKESREYQDYKNGGYEKYLENASLDDQKLMRSLIRLRR